MSLIENQYGSNLFLLTFNLINFVNQTLTSESLKSSFIFDSLLRHIWSLNRIFILKSFFISIVIHNLSRCQAHMEDSLKVKTSSSLRFSSNKCSVISD